MRTKDEFMDHNKEKAELDFQEEQRYCYFCKCPLTAGIEKTQVAIGTSVPDDYEMVDSCIPCSIKAEIQAEAEYEMP